MSEAERCPFCESTKVSQHLGRCECEDCGAEWSVSQEEADGDESGAD